MSVSEALRAESHAAIRRLTPGQRIELALRLGEQDIEMLCAARGCSRAEARAIFERTRAAGRRRSVADRSR
ncbi:MAG TPA: hypothetical protein VM364_12150 [Vicinamibacterales bacterium]|nr:hypothetical protein [Vicinamibacterales bacterium]